MSVTQVKNSMNKLNAELSNTLNSVNNLISTVNAGTVTTSTIVVSPSNRLRLNLSTLERDIKYLHNMTADELHIFFKEYNTLLSKTIVEIGRLKILLGELIEDSRVLFTFCIINMYAWAIVEGYYKVDYNLKKYIPQLVEFRTILTRLQSVTNINNSKLIIRNNRG